VEKQVPALDPGLPVYRIRTIHELISESVSRRRLSMFLLAAFAAMALLLAAVGIYGVVSYAAAQRAHEMGIRMALGARAGNVVWLVLRQSLLLTGSGLAIGVAGALLLTRFLASLLFHVDATDPMTYLAVGAFLAVVAQTASFVPAYRAATIDPAKSLREE